MTPTKTHCPVCLCNVDGVLCPRCGVLTVTGLLRRVRKPRITDGYEPLTYPVHLKRVRDGGLDVEAS
mgnify:CR=1 FL=1